MLNHYFWAGNRNPGAGSSIIHGTSVLELRSDYGTRVFVRESPDIVEIAALCHKNQQDATLQLVKKEFPG
jgi:hypothetical protein